MKASFRFERSHDSLRVCASLSTSTLRLWALLLAWLMRLSE